MTPILIFALKYDRFILTVNQRRRADDEKRFSFGLYLFPSNLVLYFEPHKNYWHSYSDIIFQLIIQYRVPFFNLLNVLFIPLPSLGSSNKVWFMIFPYLNWGCCNNSLSISTRYPLYQKYLSLLVLIMTLNYPLKPENRSLIC